MRTPMRGILFVGILLVAARGQLRAQAAANSGLSGIVVDSLDGPVPFAVVTLGDENAGTTADENGKF
ncbi:MAG: hypothetical protein ACM3ND_08780, partial [Acidobacteriota bacterium]